MCATLSCHLNCLRGELLLFDSRSFCREDSLLSIGSAPLFPQRHSLPPVLPSLAFSSPRVATHRLCSDCFGRIVCLQR